MQRKDEGSKHEVLVNMWKIIWQLKVLKRVKNFLWRAATNTTPTSGNLKNEKAVDTKMYLIRI